MTFVRTVLGDITPADLGPTYAHEHLVIDGGRPVELHPDFHLADVDRAVAELEPARAAGLATVVDAMPASAGRNVAKLASISERSGVHVVAATGLHLAKYYADDAWSETEAATSLADRFIADIVEGIDEHDYLGSTVSRTGHRAGVVKVAGSGPRLGDRDRRIFEAAALAHDATGCPVLTHCTDGYGALEQLRFLADHGVDAHHVTLSHTDKVVDRAYHAEILATGAFVEYDQGFRWPAREENGTLTLLRWMVEDGHVDGLMLGMDAARQGYWATYGGSPGWTFLLGPFAATMRDAGIDGAVQHEVFVTNPARAFAFTSPATPREHRARA